MANTQSHSGRGQVKHPESDRRLRENRASGRAANPARSEVVPGGQGRVKDPSTDGRLKQNRAT